MSSVSGGACERTGGVEVMCRFAALYTRDHGRQAVLLEMPEVIRRVLLCIPKAVEDEF